MSYNTLWQNLATHDMEMFAGVTQEVSLQRTVEGNAAVPVPAISGLLAIFYHVGGELVDNVRVFATDQQVFLLGTNLDPAYTPVENDTIIDIQGRRYVIHDVKMIGHRVGWLLRVTA